MMGKRLKVEYEVLATRAIQWKDFHDDGFDDKDIIEFLKDDQPLWRVRKITRYETDEDEA